MEIKSVELSGKVKISNLKDNILEARAHAKDYCGEVPTFAELYRSFSLIRNRHLSQMSAISVTAAISDTFYAVLRDAKSTIAQGNMNLHLHGEFIGGSGILVLDHPEITQIGDKFSILPGKPEDSVLFPTRTPKGWSKAETDTCVPIELYETDKNRISNYEMLYFARPDGVTMGFLSPYLHINGNAVDTRYVSLLDPASRRPTAYMPDYDANFHRLTEGLFSALRE